MEMEAEKQRAAGIVLQTVMSVLLGILVAINAYALKEVGDLGKQVVSNTVKIDSFIGEGPRFTSNDYEREAAVLIRILEDMDEDVQYLKDRVDRLEDFH